MKTCGTSVAAVWLAPRLEAAEDVRLKSWELVEILSLPKKLNPLLKLTAAQISCNSLPVSDHIVVESYEQVTGRD